MFIVIIVAVLLFIQFAVDFIIIAVTIVIVVVFAAALVKGQKQFNILLSYFMVYADSLGGLSVANTLCY